VDVCEAARQAVAPLWERAGLHVPPAAGIFDGLFVDPCPAGLHADDVPIAPCREAIRPAQFDGTGDLPALPMRRPLVYVTFGTHPLFATAHRLRTIAEATAAAGCGAVITGLDSHDLGSLPAGVVAHRFVPQSALLPHCDAVICHAGASTLFGALASGLPLLLMPLGADHFANASAAVQRGAALALDGDADALSIQAAITRALSDPSLRTSAAAVAAEIAAMPDAAAAAEGILTWLDGSTGAA